jgi:hypothetical protein
MSRPGIANDAVDAGKKTTKVAEEVAEQGGKVKKVVKVGGKIAKKTCKVIIIGTVCYTVVTEGPAEAAEQGLKDALFPLPELATAAVEAKRVADGYADVIGSPAKNVDIILDAKKKRDKQITQLLQEGR